ncbi:hypothetical protein I553_1477 [Mycobacterium xenopi 4042]|uniref:Uncharacterized protein n=1 Tax=Mycobacterium xenopi 4042 TaxID=1299334 RepID=X8CG48_MYCXE|nr:hypothetical protein I553_1477 [Mycobacterium xenopi 4042]
MVEVDVRTFGCDVFEVVEAQVSGIDIEVLGFDVGVRFPSRSGSTSRSSTAESSASATTSTSFGAAVFFVARLRADVGVAALAGCGSFSWLGLSWSRRVWRRRPSRRVELSC